MRAPTIGVFVSGALVALAAAGCTSELGARGPSDAAGLDAGSADAGSADTAIGAGDDAAIPDDDAAVIETDAWTPPRVDAATPCPGMDGSELDLSLVTLYANPPTLASWPVTTQLSALDFSDSGVHVVFDRQDGASRWPDVIPPGWDGPLQYTLGMVECIDGEWYGSAVLEYWYGLDAMGGNVALDDQIAVNWFYDAGRWGLLAGRQPATGEVVGFFVAAGNLRNITADDPAQSPVMERSNVVLVPFPDVAGATYTF